MPDIKNIAALDDKPEVISARQKNYTLFVLVLVATAMICSNIGIAGVEQLR